MASAVMIGDLVGSRTARDRRRLHRVLARALDDLNALLDPAEPLRITAGDEYQGTFATLGGALQASLLLRLALLPEHDVRHGIGHGAVRVLEDEPRVEDGPGWWAARAAIESVAAAESRPATRGLRTAYVVAQDADDPLRGGAAAVNAALALRDTTVSGLSERSVSVLRGLLAGDTQRDVAAALGISASAVSQRVRGDGLGAVLAAHDLMGEVP
jgi:hypothetical protein